MHIILARLCQSRPSTQKQRLGVGTGRTKAGHGLRQGGARAARRWGTGRTKAGQYEGGPRAVRRRGTGSAKAGHRRCKGGATGLGQHEGGPRAVRRRGTGRGGRAGGRGGRTAGPPPPKRSSWRTSGTSQRALFGSKMRTRTWSSLSKRTSKARGEMSTPYSGSTAVRSTSRAAMPASLAFRLKRRRAQAVRTY